VRDTYIRPYNAIESHANKINPATKAERPRPNIPAESIHSDIEAAFWIAMGGMLPVLKEVNLFQHETPELPVM
jgi:hypothetical protein